MDINIIGTPEYLYKINASGSAVRDCGSIESISHFLFSCKRWGQQRARLRQQHGDRFGDLSYALGGYLSRQGGTNIDGPLEHWKSHISVVKATIQFAKDTGRLHPSAQDAVNAEADRNERLLLRMPSLASPTPGAYRSARPR